MKNLVYVALGACFLSQLAAAAEPTYDFECDTPAGHYAYWSRTISHSIVTVTGTIMVKEKREHERWNPAITALFYPEDGKGAFGLQIYSISTQKDFFFLRITQPGDGDETPFAMIPSDTASIPITLSLAANGTLQVTAAGKSSSKKIEGFNARKIQLGCSTGDFELKEVTVSERR